MIPVACLSSLCTKCGLNRETNSIWFPVEVDFSFDGINFNLSDTCVHNVRANQIISTPFHVIAEYQENRICVFRPLNEFFKLCFDFNLQLL